jgi:hypothetical protein
MLTNQKFIQKYGNVAAYFLPQANTGEPFSDQAYREQLALGLRQKKTPTEFMNDLYVRNAENIYYPEVQKFDAQIAAAKAAGDTSAASQETTLKSQFEAQFKNQNPLLAEKLDTQGVAGAAAIDALSELRDMLKTNSVPDGQGPLLQGLISAYDGYNEFVQAHKATDSADTNLRSQALAMFNQWVTQHIAGSPLNDLYNGVFRNLNTNLVNTQPVITPGGQPQ